MNTCSLCGKSTSAICCHICKCVFHKKCLTVDTKTSHFSDVKMLLCDYCKNYCHEMCCNLEYDNVVKTIRYCPKCMMNFLPFSVLDDEELNIVLSGLTEENYRIYSICNELQFDTLSSLEANKYNFDSDIHSDENFYNSNVNIKCKYYLDDEFNMCIENSKTEYGLSMIHMNCRSLVAHFQDIVTYLKSFKIKFDVIAVSETWLVQDKHDLSDYSIDGYSLYSCPRTAKGGGGVAIYVNDLFTHDVVKTINSNNMESLFIEIALHKTKTVRVGCVYRAPNTDISEFNNELQTILEENNNKSMFICGDFNIDLLKYECHQNSQDFVNQLFSFGFYPLINMPTRVTFSSNTIIDNIYTNEVGVTMKNGIMINDISDHLPIFNLVEYSYSRNHKTKCTKYSYVRQLKEQNVSNFSERLHNLDWTDVYETDNVNACYTSFMALFTDSFNISCPVVKVKHKQENSRKPWLTKGLINACKKKNNLYKSFIKYRNKQAEIKYKTYKNKLISILRSAEKMYYCKKLKDYKNDIKSTWKILNEITQRKKGKCVVTNEFISGDKTITNDKTIADGFVEFFTNIGPSLAKKIDPCPGKDFSNFLGQGISNSIFLSPVTENEILKVVEHFRNKHSCGYDDISMSMVKSIIFDIIKPLCDICNKSFVSGVFPDSMKIAKIIPLFKSGNKKIFSNYRPVSVLPQFSKILEKLFYNRIISFVKTNSIMYNSQYGFRENHSTSLALMELFEKITSNLDNKLVTVGVFIDLKKAFDTIDHSILINKLCHYGVRGVASNWIKNYLSNRSQYVVHNNVSSEYKTIRCGVPQGSILGPILFLLYINDLANVSDKLKFILFADDTNVFHTGKNVVDVSTILNDELKNLSIWFKVNKLSLNISKTNYMIFDSKGKEIDCTISIDGVNVERVHVTKFLGVLVDDKLSWHNQISSVSRNVSKNISILYKVKYILNSDSLFTLYCSLILPYLSYACEIWGNTFDSSINKLILLQKRAIRIVDKSHYREHTDPLFVKYNCLKFKDIVNSKILSVVFQAKNNLLPENVQSLFLQNDNVHNYNTRSKSKGNFNVKYCRTKLRSLNISVKGVKLWNNFDTDVHNIKSVKLFKKHVKKVFISSYET